MTFNLLLVYFSFVITEEQKYKAYTYNITGFALMSPLGKVFLNYISLFKEIGPEWFIFNFLLSLFLFFVGLTFVDHGRSILREKRRYFNADRSS